MFGKVISYITRCDGAFKRKVSRRVSSSRASVFLEYAIILPMTILVISTMIEFAALWDAKIMANHTAWTCARIATVEAGQQTKYVDNPAVNRLRTKGMKTATILLMSTCAMGSMHGSGGDFTKYWVEEVILGPLRKLTETIKAGMTSKLTAMLKAAIGKLVGDDVVSKLVAAVVGWIADSLFTPLINLITQVIDKLFEPFFKFIGGILDGQRQVRQLAYAAGRVFEFPDIITVTELKGPPFVFTRHETVSTWGQSNLDFPRVLDDNASEDTWFVSKDAPWPPNQQSQRMINVKISWPFERAWMFPVLSPWRPSDETMKALEKMPTAVGYAMAYPQPIICNDNLKSEGATPYDPGNTNKIPDIVSQIKNKYIGFLKTAALYYHYQQTNEQIGPYDSQSVKDGSYKGIGLWGGGEERKSGKKEYYTHDGLVYWMGRGPEKPSDRQSHSAWQKAPKPPDYNRCWKEVAETDSETARMWNGWPYVGPTRPTAVYWRLRKKHRWKEWLAGDGYGYQDKEWFFWGDGSNRHLRFKHKRPYDNYVIFEETMNDTRSPSHFILPIEFSKIQTQPIYENVFRNRCGDSVPYKLYTQVMDADKSGTLKSNVYTLSDGWCNDADTARARKEEPELFNRLKIGEQRTNDDTWNMILACSKELDEAIGGGGSGDTQSDMGQFFDFDGLDDLIMKDPDKAAEIMQKKLDEMKEKVYPAVRRIDAAEQTLRNLDDEFRDRKNHWYGVRDCDLFDFAIAIAKAAQLLGSISPSAVRSELKRSGEGRRILNTLDEMKTFFARYHEAIIEHYNAELELGKLLKLKAVSGLQPKRKEDPQPLDPPKEPEDRPKPSSADSGSDDDHGGDAWIRGKDGWRRDDTQGPDV